MPTGPPAALGVLPSHSLLVGQGWAEEPAHTWGRKAEPVSPSSRATRLVTRRSLRGPERRVRGRPGLLLLINLQTGHLAGQPCVVGSMGPSQGGLRPGPRVDSWSLHLTDQGHTGTETWDRNRPTRAPRAPQTRGRCPAAPNILDRSSAASTGRRVDMMIRALPTAPSIWASSRTQTRTPLGTER